MMRTPAWPRQRVRCHCWDCSSTSALWERRWFQIIVAGRIFPGEWPQIEMPEHEMDIEDFRVDERDIVEQIEETARHAGHANIIARASRRAVDH